MKMSSSDYGEPLRDAFENRSEIIRLRAFFFSPFSPVTNHTRVLGPRSTSGSGLFGAEAPTPPFTAR